MCALYLTRIKKYYSWPLLQEKEGGIYTSTLLLRDIVVRYSFKEHKIYENSLLIALLKELNKIKALQLLHIIQLFLSIYFLIYESMERKIVVWIHSFMTNYWILLQLCDPPPAPTHLALVATQILYFLSYGIQSVKFSICPNSEVYIKD